MNKLRQLLLASQSPRRRAMIAWLGLSVNTISANIDECAMPAETPPSQALRLAVTKARAITGASGQWVLAADTIVDLAGQALGKPASVAEARRILSQLRSCSHRVHTGIALFVPDVDLMLTRIVTTSVQMRPYTDAELCAYVATGDPMDKAGAYAIQHPEFHPVKQLQRCYANVVGLPLCAVVALLAELGLEIEVAIPTLCRTHFDYHCPAIDAGVSISAISTPRNDNLVQRRGDAKAQPTRVRQR